jgi:hydroxymethylpyrimidine/phosphomethylpyrimidine kinase
VKPRSAIVLSVAGSDSIAGAGIQADLRTLSALGGYACTAITAVTVQNSKGVRSINPVKPKIISEQILAILEDFKVGAVKTGLIPNEASVRSIAQSLKKYPKIPLIIDPVIGSSSGTQFLSKKALLVLKKTLFPRALLVTPNLDEAERLSGMQITSGEDLLRAALAILKTGCGAVLVKGGHAQGSVCTDVLILKTGQLYLFSGSRIKTQNTHGTGCVLSSAIAYYVARGDSMAVAVRKAKSFLRKHLVRGKAIKWGEGCGPALGLF